MVPFVGPSYHLATRKADVQRSVNLFPVMNEVVGGKTEAYLQAVPGLDVFSAVPPAYEYFTSILYPFIVQDALSVAVGAVQRGTVLGITQDTLSAVVPTLQSGTLVVSISYLTYNRPTFPDTLSTAVPTLQSGTLLVTIAYLTYNQPAFPDTLAAAVPTLQSGTLVVTVNYLDYLNGITYPDTMSVGVPTLTGGTLV